MADEGNNQDLGPDSLVEALAPGGGQPPPTVVLTGFLGESPDAGTRRLYLDASLRHYVDIPAEAILRSERSEAEGSPFGSTTTLWVRAGTPLHKTVVNSQHVQAEFLQGPIAGAAVTPGPAGGAATGAMPGLPTDIPRQPRAPLPSDIGCVPTAWCHMTLAGPLCFGHAGLQAGIRPQVAMPTFMCPSQYYCRPTDQACPSQFYCTEIQC
jgi:hypothetical protein